MSGLRAGSCCILCPFCVCETQRGFAVERVDSPDVRSVARHARLGVDAAAVGRAARGAGAVRCVGHAARGRPRWAWRRRAWRQRSARPRGAISTLIALLPMFPAKHARTARRFCLSQAASQCRSIHLTLQRWATTLPVQQSCYQDYRAALDRAQASADEAEQLLHHCRETMEDAVVALSTPSESAVSDDGAQEEDISPIGDYWAQVAHASGGSGQLQAQGKFWSQKVQLQALTRNVQAFKENRSQLLCVVAETAHLQVRTSSPEMTAYHLVSLQPARIMVHMPTIQRSRRSCRPKSCGWPRRQRR